MNIAFIVAIFILCLILIKSTDATIVSIKRLSHRSVSGIFGLSAIILAVGTSLPEMFVGITSAAGGVSSLSLGDVTGSNIANISLVAGFAALLAGEVSVYKSVLRRDVITALVAGILPMLLMLDGSISRVDGLVLLTIYVGYVLSFYRKRRGEMVDQHKKQSTLHKIVRSLNHMGSRRNEILRFLGSLAVMLVSAFVVVRIAVTLSETVGVPSFVVGLLVVSIGTSLPEFVFSVRSIEDREPTMFFGNLLGSIVVNSTLILGLVAVISPITVVSVEKYYIAAIAFVVIFVTFWFFVRSKHRLDRWEAAVLVIMYFIFVLAEVT